MYKIKQFSDLVGVSIRMLRHYDKIGLLVPQNINKFNNYRYYGGKNLATIQQVLFFKELDFSLQEIKAIINDSSFDPLDALSMQRNLLQLKQQRLESMVKFIDDLIINTQSGEFNMAKIKQAMNNDNFNQQKLAYAKEAKDKWGDSDRYKQSQTRMAKYSKQDIEKLNQQQAKIYQELTELMPQGVENSQVQAKVHQARMFISDNWYDCNPKQFAALGEMYVADERFKANIDRYGTGLAAFLKNAIQIYVSK